MEHRLHLPAEAAHLHVRARNDGNDAHQEADYAFRRGKNAQSASTKR